MDTAEKLLPTGQLLTLTREMLLSAQAGDWEKLTKLEKARLPLFDQVFAHGITDNVELAREVLSIDEKTKSLAKAEMPAIQDELRKIKNSGKASMAYQTIQGFTSNNK
ncbi:MAG TPA: flagellar protein FliT [Gammaproteobacteria bacterium]|nr:flagellar protein FliT [Gammaproteobacteria bacterium]